MFTKLEIQGFRGINHLVIDDLKRVNILVGENNCGKTSILEALFLLLGGTNPGLALGINTFRNYSLIDETGWVLFFNKLDNSSPIKIHGEMQLIGNRSLIIKPNYQNALTQNVGNGMDIKGPISTESIPSMNGLVFELYRNDGNKEQEPIITKLPPDDTAPVQIKTESLPGIFLADPVKTTEIARRFDKIQRKKHTDRFIKLLRQIEPSLTKIALGTDGIVFCDVGLEKMVPINFLGTGTLTLFAIVLAIFETPNGIVLIDEIENGFYRKSQEILWTAILNAAKEFNVQIFATTHSIECLSALCAAHNKLSENEGISPEDNDIYRLYRIEKRAEDFKVISYDHSILEASLESGWEVR